MAGKSEIASDAALFMTICGLRRSSRDPLPSQIESRTASLRAGVQPTDIGRGFVPTLETAHGSLQCSWKASGGTVSWPTYAPVGVRTTPLLRRIRSPSADQTRRSKCPP